MSKTNWSKSELREANFHPWLRNDYCPAALRDLRKVLADAEPELITERDTIVYRWWVSGGDWWGVCPPAGIMPSEVVNVIQEMNGTRDFRTVKEAKQALQRAAAKLDSRIPAVV